MLNGMSKHNYALISADYRLAPQTHLLSILCDVLDCLNFIRKTLSSLIPTSNALDTNRITLLGSSAGGYIALLAAVYADPKPDVVLAIYPITNPLGAFFSQPQPQPIGKIDRSAMATFLDKDAETISDPDPKSERNKLYYYMLQEAILPEPLGLQDGDEKFVVAKSVMNHGKEGLPPIYIVYGDADRLVGVEQADEVAKALEDAGAVYEYDRVKGLGHLFDRYEAVQLEDMYAFMRKYN